VLAYLGLARLALDLAPEDDAPSWLACLGVVVFLLAAGWGIWAEDALLPRNTIVVRMTATGLGTLAWFVLNPWQTRQMRNGRGGFGLLVQIVLTAAVISQGVSGMLAMHRAAEKVGGAQSTSRMTLPSDNSAVPVPSGLSTLVPSRTSARPAVPTPVLPSAMQPVKTKNGVAGLPPLPWHMAIMMALGINMFGGAIGSAVAKRVPQITNGAAVIIVAVVAAGGAAGTVWAIFRMHGSTSEWTRLGPELLCLASGLLLGTLYESYRRHTEEIE